jgi:hypothetical protein
LYNYHTATKWGQLQKIVEDLEEAKRPSFGKRYPRAFATDPQDSSLGVW